LKNSRTKATPEHAATPLSPLPAIQIPATNSLSASFVMLVIVFGFAWYLFVSFDSGTFESIVNVGQNIILNLGEFFVKESRDPSVLMAVGQASPDVVSLPRQVFLVVQYVTQFFIVAGVTGLLLSLRKARFQPEFITMTLVSSLLLLMSIVLPFFTKSIGIARIYHITLFLLAPFCVLGGISFFKKFFRLIPNSLDTPQITSICTKLVVALVLIPYFLFYAGFVYALSGDVQTSVSLATDEFRHIFTQKEDVVAAKWLREADSLAKVKSDDHSVKILASYAGYSPGQRLSFTNQNLDKNDAPFIFLSSGNIAKDKILVLEQSDWGDRPWLLSLDNGTLFEQTNRIYDNGAVIYATRQIPAE
jgi:uncharacterized membrane protein